ncbi:MAG: hypothetical protein ACX94C_11755 [Phycisphaerales bacterium]
MSQNADDQLYAWLRTTIGSVSAVASIVKHDLARDDHALSNKKHVPRLEYNPFRYDPKDGASEYRGGFGITLHHSRANNRAYGGSGLVSEGDLWTVEAALIGALSNNVPTLSGFGVSPIEFSSRPRPTIGDEGIVTRRLSFLLSVYPGGTAPLSGNDAELQGLTPDADVVSWFVNVEAGTHARFTGRHDTEQRLRCKRPGCRVSIRTRVPAGSAAVFPAVGSRVSITLKAGDSASFAVSALIQSIVWDPNQDNPSRPQYATVRARIDENSSGIFSGSA